MILTPDGSEAHEIDLTGPASAPEALGRDAGRQLRKAGGDAFFASWQ